MCADRETSGHWPVASDRACHTSEECGAAVCATLDWSPCHRSSGRHWGYGHKSTCTQGTARPPSGLQLVTGAQTYSVKYIYMHTYSCTYTIQIYTYMSRYTLLQCYLNIHNITDITHTSTLVLCLPHGTSPMCAMCTHCKNTTVNIITSSSFTPVVQLAQR